jgi:hypothetical protein
VFGFSCPPRRWPATMGALLGRTPELASFPDFVSRVWFLRIDVCRRFAANDPYGGAQHSRRVHTIRLKTVGTLVTNPRMPGGCLVAAGQASGADVNPDTLGGLPCPPIARYTRCTNKSAACGFYPWGRYKLRGLCRRVVTSRRSAYDLPTTLPLLPPKHARTRAHGRLSHGSHATCRRLCISARAPTQFRRRSLCGLRIRHGCLSTFPSMRTEATTIAEASLVHRATAATGGTSVSLGHYLTTSSAIICALCFPGAGYW